MDPYTVHPFRCRSPTQIERSASCALYVIVRAPHRDEVAAAVAEFGARLGRAVATNDDRAARAVLDDIAEWLLRMRRVVTVRLESSFRNEEASLPIGKRRP